MFKRLGDQPPEDEVVLDRNTGEQFALLGYQSDAADDVQVACLLRQYLPKGIGISTYSQAKLNAVARRLNERPRKTLDFQTPAEMFSQFVASIG